MSDNIKPEIMEEEDIEIILGERLKELHELNGTDEDDINELLGRVDRSKTNLLKKLDLKEKTYNNYLYDTRKPPMDVLVKIARFFNTSTDYLLGSSEFNLDSWAPEFLEIFSNYSREVIKDHFSKRNNDFLKLLDGKNHLLLAHLIEDAGLFDSCLEDLSQSDQKKYLCDLEVIMNTISKIIDIYNRDGVDGEFGALNVKLDKALRNEVSFKGLETALDTIELSKEEKIVAIKNIIEKNNRENNKAIRMLNELLEE